MTMTPKQEHVHSIVFFYSLCRAESMGEVAALEATLQHKADVHVKVGTWRWSETSQWPPLGSVLRTPLWTSPWYEEVRNRLMRPAPEIKVTAGGTFLTIDVREQAGVTITETASQAAAPAPGEPVAHEGEQVSPCVPLLGACSWHSCSGAGRFRA
jgi:hypothetical protein